MLFNMLSNDQEEIYRPGVYFWAQLLTIAHHVWSVISKANTTGHNTAVLVTSSCFLFRYLYLSSFTLNKPSRHVVSRENSLCSEPLHGSFEEYISNFLMVAAFIAPLSTVSKQPF